MAVNHALTRIVTLRPEIASLVVRAGREDKAAGTANLLLDRQLQCWGKEVLDRSDAHMAEWQSRVSGSKGLADALAILAESSGLSQARGERQQDQAKARQALSAIVGVYGMLEQALAATASLRQQADGLVSKAAPGDDRLTKTLRSFQDDYLGWVDGFLMQADRVAGLSQKRVEALESVRRHEAEIERISKQVASGIELVNGFLRKEFQKEFGALAEQQAFLSHRFAAQREDMERLGRAQRLLEDWRQRVGKDLEGFSSAYLSQCRVVGATCIGVAAKGDVGEMDFDWVIVDEAGRATHPELLVPLVRGRRIVLVGDHRQLPPTIDSALENAMAGVEGLDRRDLETSLFQELMGSQIPDCLKLALDVQYRMHPAIGGLIANAFYGGTDRLKPGVDAGDRVHGLTWVTRPVLWYSTKRLKNHDEVEAGLSRCNEAEMDVILHLLDKMEASYASGGDELKTVGIVTGYLAQKAALRQRVDARRKQWPHLPEIEVDTVDAYQGRERDIIIYSVVRSNPEGKIGFLRDDRRLNVALSRARDLLIIVGNEDVELANVRGSNPFYSVIQYIRSHPADCRMEAYT